MWGDEGVKGTHEFHDTAVVAILLLSSSPLSKVVVLLCHTLLGREEHTTPAHQFRISTLTCNRECRHHPYSKLCCNCQVHDPGSDSRKRRHKYECLYVQLAASIQR